MAQAKRRCRRHSISLALRTLGRWLSLYNREIAIQCTTLAKRKLRIFDKKESGRVPSGNRIGPLSTLQVCEQFLPAAAFDGLHDVVPSAKQVGDGYN